MARATVNDTSVIDIALDKLTQFMVIYSTSAPEVFEGDAFVSIRAELGHLRVDNMAWSECATITASLKYKGLLP